MPMAQNIREMETTYALPMSIVRTIIDDWYWISKTGLKITLVCYHLNISKMTITGSVGHVSDLSPFLFGMLLKRNNP